MFPRSVWRSLLLAAALAQVCPVLPEAHADTASTLSARKADLSDLKARINDLQREISSTEDSRSASLAALRDSERAVSEARRTLDQTTRALDGTRARLGDLQQDMRTVGQRIEARQGELGEWLREHYMHGSNGSLAQLLGGTGDVAALARESYYLERIGRARFRLIEELRADLAEKARLAEETRSRNAELQALETRYRSQQQQLAAVAEQRKQALAVISRQLAGQRNEVGNLQQDETRMTSLIEGLTRLAKEEEARRRERAERERVAREQREARMRAARERAQAEQAARRARMEAARVAAARRVPAEDTVAVPPPVEVAEPRPAPEPVRPAPEEPRDLPPEPTGVAFAHLQGRLPMPVRGHVANRFGSPRSGGALSWKGIFIAAAAGSAVHAVAAGNVVFSDWMRGFGNLIILDHGKGYLSVYGNNDALLKQVGDSVRGGEAIAQVGASNGGAESGLYFEIRLQGRPLDPMKWVRAGN